MKQVLLIPWVLSPVTKSLLIENQIGNIRHWITEQVAEIRLSSLVKYVQRTKSVYESMLNKKKYANFSYICFDGIKAELGGTPYIRDQNRPHDLCT